jgi:hypothetical protein
MLRFWLRVRSRWNLRVVTVYTAEPYFGGGYTVTAVRERSKDFKEETAVSIIGSKLIRTLKRRV